MNAPFRSLLASGIEAFVGIVRFRKGPEDVPASTLLLAVVLAGSVVLGLVQLAIPANGSGGSPIVAIAVDIVIWMACVRIALQAAGTPERFLQTITAIYGCQLVLAPLLIGTYWMLVTYNQQAGLGGLASLFSAVVVVWLLLITARILRSATQWPLFATVLLALAIESLKLLVTLGLYPPDPAATPTAWSLYSSG